MANTVFVSKTGLTGGTATDLDGIDGDNLADGDKAIIQVSDDFYYYHLNGSSGAAESVPDIIAPDSNPGNKRWILKSPYGGANFIQAVTASTSAVVSGSTIMPMDDSIPQNTEGFEVITAAITPTDTSNLLLIDFFCNAWGAGALHGAGALFQDSTAGALATASWGYTFADNSLCPFTLSHKMTAGTTSSTTFKIRVGPAAAVTIYVNASTSGGTRFGGGVSSTILRIMEVKP